VGVFSSGEEENYFDIAIAIYAHDGSVSLRAGSDPVIRK
jgi:hypothetical protein